MTDRPDLIAAHRSAMLATLSSLATLATLEPPVAMALLAKLTAETLNRFPEQQRSIALAAFWNEMIKPPDEPDA